MANQMKTIRFHEHGEPGDVLRMEEAAVPQPNAGHITVKVYACGLNPADWSLCRGMSAKKLPCGIGLDVSGVVVAIGEGVIGVAMGDAVYGPADFTNYESAGASDYAVLYHWECLPDGLTHIKAAALPMVVETASRYLDWSGLEAGQTLVVNGGGTMVGFAAVQIALRRGAKVITTAGNTFADQLRGMGALVAGHGDGMVKRVQSLLGRLPDVIIDAAPVNLDAGSGGTLSELIKITGGDARRIITIADFAGAAKYGVRTGTENVQAEGGFKLRWNALGEYGQLAAANRFSIPVSQTFAHKDWREAMAISVAGRSRGKLVLTVQR